MPQSNAYVASADLARVVAEEFEALPIIDFHTHLFSPALGKLGLWGIDELVTYHYLEAELFRSNPISPETYFALDKKAQADLIWKTLFVDHPPVSESTRGVVAVLKSFNLPTDAKDLTEARAFFAAQTLDSHIDNVFKLAGIDTAVMTNDPLDPAEAPLWESAPAPDKRFKAVLRLDRILNKWSEHWQVLAAQGYKVDANLGGNTLSEVRRFLDAWIARMKPVYMACSLPDTFAYPEDSTRARLLAGAVLPTGQAHRLPLALMIGPRYLVNPRLKLAGDGVGKADLRAVEHLCVEFPDNRFFISLLSRENQHEICVYARKFANLMPFGCWWFLNQPSIVEEMTRERLEMLGTTFIPQHSDARVLEQVIYKWRNSRRTIAPIVANGYKLMCDDGRGITREEIRRDLHRMFRENFQKTAGIE